MFAELRATIFLDMQGFDNIQPLHAKNAKEADILATYGKDCYTIEVADSIYDADNRSTAEQLGRWAASKAVDGGELSQIDAT